MHKPTNRLSSFEGSASSIHTLLILAVLALGTGCTAPSDNTTQSTPPHKMAMALPSGIAAAKLDTTQLKAYLTVDNGQRLAMTLSQDGNSFERSVDLKTGQHTFTIEFEYAQDKFGNQNTLLADSSTTFDVKKGNNALQFQDSQYKYDTKSCDTDGYTNLQEISMGSNPCSSASVPIAGVWWLKNNPPKSDPVYSNNICSIDAFNPRLSVSQNAYDLTAVDDSGVKYIGSIDKTTGDFTLTGSKTWIDATNTSMTVTETITGQVQASDNISATMTRSLSANGGTPTCSVTNQTLLGQVVFQPSGQDYSGLYGLEDVGFNQATSTSPTQGAVQLQIEIQGTLINIYGTGTGSMFSGIYDPDTGSFSVLQTIDTANIDADHDGVANDFSRQVEVLDGLFTGPPGSGNSTVIAGTHIEQKTTYLNTSSYNPSATPYSVEQNMGHYYGKPVATTVIAKTVLHPDSGLGQGSVQSYRLGLNNPPLKTTNATGQLSINIVDPNIAPPNNVICTASYAKQYRQIIYLPDVDFKNEQSQDGEYGSIDCDVDVNAAAPLNTTADYYQVDVMEDGSNLVASFPLTAPTAVLPTQRPDYRTINLNGAVASQTLQADPLPISGFFNFNNDLPNISWPVMATMPSMTLDNYVLELSRPDEPNRIFRLISIGNTTTLPQNSLLQDLARYNNSATLKLTANFTTADGNPAQSDSRSLLLYPGLNGLFNMEMVPTTGSTLVGQFSANSANSSLPDVNCVVTRNYDPTNTTCTGTIDWATDQLAATITDSSTTPAQTFSLTASFTDSATADLSVTDGTVSASGQGRAVNTELSAYSVLGVNEGTTWNLTALDVKNPNPYYDQGILKSASGQDLGYGQNTPFTLWSDANTYLTNYSSYETLPLNGVKAQTFMTNMAYRSNGGSLKSDTLTAVLSNSFQPNDKQTYTAQYQYTNPNALFASSLLPPARTQFSINGTLITGTSGTSTNPIVLPQNTAFTVSWEDTTTTDTNLRPKLQWRLRVFLVSDNHSDRRSPWMSETELTPSGTTLGWTIPAELISNFTGDAILNLRIRDSANTMRGASDNIYLQFN